MAKFNSLTIMVFLLALILIISVVLLAKRLAGKSISGMTYLVLSGTLTQSVLIQH